MDDFNQILSSKLSRLIGPKGEREPERDEPA
jgi:hypothetical protein